MNEEEKKIIEEEGLYFVEPDKKEKEKNTNNYICIYSFYCGYSKYNILCNKLYK